MSTNLVIDSTVAGTEANSYIETSWADDYWSGHYSTTKSGQWAALTVDQKTTLLISATRIIDTARFTFITPISEYNLHYDYRTGLVTDITLNLDPCRYYYYQKLQFPRNLDVDPTTNATYIPVQVMMATAEQAVYLLNFDDSALSTRLQGITSDTLSVGKGQLHTSQQFTTQGSMYSPMAMELLRPFFVTGSKVRRA